MTFAPITLSTLASEINLAHANVRRTSRESVMHALRAGALLIEARQQVAYGKWQAWLRENFDGSYRTAALYVRMAERPEEVQSVAHLGVAGVQRHLAERRQRDPLLRDQLQIPDERDVAEFFDPDEPEHNGDHRLTYEAEMARYREAMGDDHEPKIKPPPAASANESEVVRRREVLQSAAVLQAWTAAAKHDPTFGFDQLLDEASVLELIDQLMKVVNGLIALRWPEQVGSDTGPLAP
jgi:Protein of unknown function (DUF3102)